MNHNQLAPAPKQEADSWDTPIPEAPKSDWDTNLWDTPEATVESPKRKGLAKRLGEKVASITRKTGAELADQSLVGQLSTEGERKESRDSLETAKEELRVAKEKLAEREAYFDNQQYARLPKSDGSGFSNEIPKSQLSTSEIEQAKHFDAQREHLAVDRAQKAVETAQASTDQAAASGW